MSTRRVCVVLALFLMRLSSEAAATPSAFEGDWIGGFDGNDGTVFIAAHFEPQGEALSGRIDIPLRGDHKIPLHNVTTREAKLTFEVPGAYGNLLFEGKQQGDRIFGSVRQTREVRRFTMMKLAPLDPETAKAVTGTYEIAPGQPLLVTRSNGQLLYLDHTRGRMGLLYPTGPRTFVSGPSLVAGYPVELTITFDAPADGAAPALTYQPTGKPAVRAERRTWYTIEPVSFVQGDVRIGASLLLPLGPGPHPAIVMSHGSGAVTRDMLHPYADVFARNGIAVLMPDKRGTGSSTGNWSRATFDDLADDALAGVAYLRTRPEINPRQIGLQGSSMGGWVAPLAASRSADVAFVIVESAPVLTPVEHERLRVRSQLRADGFAPAQIAKALAYMDEKFKVARTGQGWQGLESATAQGARDGWISYVNAPTSLESLQWHWQHVLSYDPLPALTRLTCPLLVLYGERDTIVPPAEHRARMEQALRDARHPDATIKVFERANHGFFESITGGRREAAGLKSLVPGYLDARVDWVRQHVTVSSASATPVRPAAVASRQAS